MAAASRMRGGDYMVSWSELFSYTMVLLAVATLIITIKK